MSEKKTTRHLIAGFSGGLASAVCLQPLDLIKTRVQQSSSTSILTVFKEVKSVSQLWRGTVPSAIRTSMGSAMYLTSLNMIRITLRQINSYSILIFTSYLITDRKPLHGNDNERNGWIYNDAIHSDQSSI
ncbi:unnamed protein product [Ambrosiozyma monospora]|uniref:Unnamed protein product n=1 Tax=Ambrosiozyma monospora TaxID=43982 RepID=A0A9W6Z4X9_AMBMO|nr:unnamed protein product [Ambrosiozyma monospora]